MGSGMQGRIFDAGLADSQVEGEGQAAGSAATPKRNTLGGDADAEVAKGGKTGRKRRRATGTVPGSAAADEDPEEKEAR